MKTYITYAVELDEQDGSGGPPKDVADWQGKVEVLLKAEVEDLLNSMKHGSCWCDAGIDNPMMQGRHTAECLAVKEFLRA